MTLNEAERRRQAAELKERIEGMFPQMKYLSHDEFTALMKEHDAPLLMDVREAEEIALGTLPHAQDAETARRQLVDISCGRKRRVVCFCTVGLRSGIEGARLQADGHEVWNYSVAEHLWGGNDLVRSDGTPWDRRLHVFIRRYENVMPGDLQTEAFGLAKAVIRGLPTLPGVLSAVAFGGRWRAHPRE